MQTPPAIRIDNLVKEYASPGPGEPPKLALKGVSFDVPQGGIFGLLGPNGAGKSTLINILAGLVRKTGGNAEIWGFDTDDNPRNAKRSIGIVPQEIVFDPFFTPYEVLENQGGFYGIGKKDRRSEDLLKAVHLWDKRDAYARTPSADETACRLPRRWSIHRRSRCSTSRPPGSMSNCAASCELVIELNREDVTVVLTTHYLEEAEQLCDRIAIINHELIADKPTCELVDTVREKIVSITVDKDLGGPIMGPPTKAEVINRGGRSTYDRDRTARGRCSRSSSRTAIDRGCHHPRSRPGRCLRPADRRGDRRLHERAWPRPASRPSVPPTNAVRLLPSVPCNCGSARPAAR